MKIDGGGGIGWHFSRYLGIQGGADYYRKASVDIAGANAGLMLTYPANDRFSIYGALDGSYLHATSNRGTYADTRQSTGYRVGIGLEYWFHQPFGLRAGYYRQDAGGWRTR